MRETHEDREGLILANAELRRKLQSAIRQANALRREVHAWRAWREGSVSIVAVLAARRETDSAGAFRCLDDSGRDDVPDRPPSP
jgi:hypothetical protein